jgi:hypothetical protein
MDIQKPNFLFPYTVAVRGVYNDGYAAISNCWMLLQPAPLTCWIKSQVLAHVIQTDVPMAVICHVNLNGRAIELKRKAVGDLWHGVLLVLGRQKMRCHMAPHLLRVAKRWKDVRLSIFSF